MPNPFRNLPSVNQLLESEPLRRMVDKVNHSIVANGVRDFLDDMRQQVAQATEDVSIPSPGEIAETIATWLENEQRPRLRPVINASGVLLHTGLGRAPLAPASIAEIQAIAGGYSSVELDLDSGQRGQRVVAIEKLLCELTGAEAACVVNNNAAATMITLAAVAANREVIVSRGQLIEIGGSYRLPEVMQCSGSILREVGTTNKTRIFDYEEAINENTGALLKVHPSNYVVVGFAETASIEELVQIGRKRNLPVIDDVGSGALIDFSEFGMQDEPIVSQSVAAGADLVLFSGDKLVGGPQCGIIVGRRKYIDRIMRHPLMRAMRVGKLTLAGLQATLRLYRKPDQARLQIPLLKMLSTPIENLKLRAEKLVGQIEQLDLIKTATATETESMLGGGTLPTQQIPGWGVAIEPNEISVDELARRFRQETPSLVGRINDQQLLLDFRTIDPSHDVQLVELISRAASE